MARPSLIPVLRLAAWAGGAWPLARCSLLALACGAPLSAAVPGLPQPTAPLPAPEIYVDTGNDSLSDEVENRDDFRTATLDAGYLGHDLAVAGNTSILTDRAARTRIDQFTASAGYSWTPPSSLGSYVSAGVGLRGWGDFGGQHVQDGVHRFAGYTQLDFRYGDTQRFDPLGYVSSRYVFLTDTPAISSWFGPPGRWGLMLSAAGLATTRGDFEGESELDALYAGRQGSMWLGGSFHDEGGDLPSSTAKAVAAHERGWWLMAGTSIQPWREAGIVLDAGIDPHTEGAFGRFGLECFAPSAVDSRQVQAAEIDLGSYSASVIGVQVRWRPVHLLPAGPPWLARWLRSELFLDYRFGHIPHLSIPDDTSDCDQLLLGPAETITPPSLFGILKLSPYGYAGGGVRIERLQPTGADPAFAAQQATRPVASLGCGLRLSTSISADPEHVAVIDRIRLGAGYDRWFPIGSATATSSTATVRYQVPNWSLGGYIGFLLDW